MPRYDFRCGCGTAFVAGYPLASVPDTAACPDCGNAARRGVSSPHLGRTSSATYGLMDRAARSAHEPQIVSGSVPGARRSPGTPVTTNPLHAKLPRP
ncbi:FmdB family zinc ribbon protein [Microbacterium halotolerans]|uniref:FmdB family zinc ribbon protein n=1 Tax=Microbacterium halotolerans TaxID=246613 RepID=UPI000E6A9DC8|nr:FmdB family zinc ribbon protein [Microbacterium halotolerans]